MTYLVKVRRGKPPVAAEEVRVRWREKRRTTGTIDIGGTPFGRVVENAGWDRSQVIVRPAGDPKPIYGNGRRAANYIAGPVPWTAVGIKTVLRRLRPEEAAELAAIDARIAEHEAAIAALRDERSAAQARAWDKAHVVRLNELEPKEGY